MTDSQLALGQNADFSLAYGCDSGEFGQQELYQLRPIVHLRGLPLETWRPSSELGDEPLMRLILHVGMPKAGSTTIQRWAQAKRKLLATYGFNYPTFAERQVHYRTRRHVSTGNGNDLAYALLQDQGIVQKVQLLDIELVKRDILNEFSHHSNQDVLISHEDLVSVSSPAVKRFVEDIRHEGISCIAIIYLRDQISWLASDYQQFLRQLKARHDIFEHVGFRLPFCEYVQYCRKWANLVGKENLRVRLLSEATVRENLIYDFFLTVGSDIKELKTIKQDRANESINAPAVPLLAAANRLQGLSGKIHHEILAGLIKFSRECPSNYTLPSGLTRLIAAHFKEHNKVLCGEFLNQTDAEELQRLMHVAEQSPHERYEGEIVQFVRLLLENKSLRQVEGSPAGHQNDVRKDWREAR